MAADALDRRGLGRALSALERGADWVPAPIGSSSALADGCRILGITGAPGAGKSTLTNALISHVRGTGRSVAALAVDPSPSPGSGALLGDRVRMSGYANDAEVFVRSLAARGALGGLSAALVPSLDLLEQAGFDVVLVESVGVGQSEADIGRVADTVVHVVAGDIGDDIQLAKAGNLELAHVIAVNKVDLPGGEALARAIARAMARRPGTDGRWRPRVVSVTARNGNLGGLVSAIEAHQQLVGPEGRTRRRRARLEFALRQGLHAALDRAQANETGRCAVEAALDQLETGTVSAGEAVAGALKALCPLTGWRR